MLAIGDPAPKFTLPDQDGLNWTLPDDIGNGGLVLYFYPADFTPVCTRQACQLRDIHDELAEQGIKVVGISPQDSDSHRRFESRHELPFRLLADPEQRVISLYGCKLPLGLGVRRRSFLVDPDGIIRDILTADFMASRHQQFARNAHALLASHSK